MNTELVQTVMTQLKRHPPKTKRDLKNYIKIFLGIDIPHRSICPHHNSPMDYLWHAWQESRTGGNKDCIVWANRGGGKTMLAAVATLLDCIFKPDCKIRILGGSYEQSSRMYNYLKGFINDDFLEYVNGKMLKNSCKFKAGGDVEVLTQSAKSVRGGHVQKLRCDEIELFDRDVFDGAKFMTKSTNSVNAAMEILSTMHKPYGLMNNIVASATQNKTPIFKWCLWEVIEKCTDRSCSQCPLNSYCQAKAKSTNGYLKIDDVISMMKRSSRSSFLSEMLCERPNTENVVFATFDRNTHIASCDYNPDRPLYRAIDFGYVNPFVCLWIQTDDDDNIYIIDEYVRSRAAVSVHAEKIKELTPCDPHQVSGTFCDPAGAGRNDVTGTSAVRELKSFGIRATYRRSGINEGIELIRRALKNGQGQSKLKINPKCANLIKSMTCYHYPENPKGCANELPEKDGVHDHAIDALRYFFVNYKIRRTSRVRNY